MSSSNTNLIYNVVTKVVSISNKCIEETDLYVAIPDDNEFHIMLIEE